MSNYSSRSPRSVEQMFDSIADNYDRANSMMSLRLHKRWNRSLVSAILERVKPRATLLDLCAGTGDIALDYLQRSAPSAKAYLLDFSKQMLAHADAKAKKLHLSQSHAIEFLVANAEKIPLPDQAVDAITIAYGFRNVCDPKACAADAYRVLKKGGTLGILELTRPKNPLLRAGHSLYLSAFLPVAARLCTKNREAYNYLTSSIRSFLSPEQIAQLLNEAGFCNLEISPFNGGIATLILARKVV